MWSQHDMWVKDEYESIQLLNGFYCHSQNFVKSMYLHFNLGFSHSDDLISMVPQAVFKLNV